MAFVAAVLIAGAGAGCHGFSICDRPGVTTGQLVRAKSSPLYFERTLRGSDGAHVACRAEGVIPVTLGFMRENEAEICNHTGVCAQPNGPDTVMTPNTYLRRPETTSEGNLRVLGIGRGVDAEDCGKVAVQACDEAIDYYFATTLAMRPPTVGCTLGEDRVRCERAPPMDPVLED
jgi:hypothetical protein